ncbi:MAG: hypothetical protein E4H09_01765, partial [Spirochaetales bacterium]
MAQSKEKISDAIQNEFVSVVESAFGSRLESILVYGSYLKETFIPGVSDVNVLIVLKEVNPRELRTFGHVAHRHIRRYNITPLVLSRTEFITSADVFPMEHLDIVDTHKVLFGPDVTVDLTIGRDHLRHEIEHQLRGNLLSLRQLAVAAGEESPGKKRSVRKELEHWFGSLSAILRGVLRLYGVTALPATALELVEKVNAEVGLESGPILRLLECRG